MESSEVSIVLGNIEFVRKLGRRLIITAFNPRMEPLRAVLTGLTPGEFNEKIVECGDIALVEKFLSTPDPEIRNLMNNQVRRVLSPTRTRLVPSCIPQKPTESKVPSPTEPYYDFRTDIPTLVDPTAPRADFSGEIPKTVDPLAPHYDFRTDIPTLVDPTAPRADFSGEIPKITSRPKPFKLPFSGG